MNPLSALRLGWSTALKRKNAIVLYWLFHTAFALMLAIPLAGTAIELVAKTKYGEELLREFDLMFLMEAVYRTGEPSWPFFLAGSTALVVIIAVQYMTGGAIHVLQRQDLSYSTAVFWEGAGLYFWRFLRICLYSAIAWIPFLIVRGTIRAISMKLWGEGMEEAPIYASTQLNTIVGLLLAGYAVTVLDYTRIRVATTGTRRAFMTLLRTMLWVAKNPLYTFGPWAILGLLIAIATAAYLRLANWMPASIMPLAVILIILQQVYVVFRVLLRFVGWGTQIEIDRTIRGDNENHGPEQEVFSHVLGGGGDGTLRASAAADPEAESPEAG